MPISYTIIILILVCCLWRVVCSKIKKEQANNWKIFNFILFVIWMTCVIYMTIFARDTEIDEINLIPFHSIIDVLNGDNIELLRALWMNVLLFVPGSMWLHYSFSEQNWKKRIFQIIFFVLISICIEFVQGYFNLGVVEVDDVIHNTSGAVIGTTANLWSERLICFIKYAILKIKNNIVKYNQNLSHKCNSNNSSNE